MLKYKKTITYKKCLKAFTLAEMMVVMLILSIALAASMPILTKRATSSKGELWRRVTTDVSRIYYGTSDGQHVQIGSKSTPQNGIASSSKLFINSTNPLASPQLAFGVNGAYGGVIYVESPSKMNVRLASSTGNTFLLENADLQVEGNSIIKGSNTVSGNGTFGGTLTVGSTSQFNNSVNIGSLGTNYSFLLNGRPIANGVPVGTIIIWAVSSAPNSGGVWLECNGQSFSAETYPELYAVLGKTTVPNYQAMFLRGHGSQGINGYNYSTTTLGDGDCDRSRHIWGALRGAAQRLLYDWDKGINGCINSYDVYGSVDGGVVNPAYNWGSGFNIDNSRQVPTSDTDSYPAHRVVKYFIKAAN